MKLALLGPFLGTALAGALVVSSLPAQAAAPAPMTRRGSERATAVAPGSYLTVVDRGPDQREFGGIEPRSQSLVLVSPTGEQRVVYTHKVQHFLTFVLADWSVDGATALLLLPDRAGGDLIKVDVATGATQSISVPRLNSAMLDPTGAGAVVTTFKGKHSSTLELDAVSWAGTVTRLRDSVSGAMIAGPSGSGTVLTADGKNGRQQLLLSTTTGAVVNDFHGKGFCSAVRWWDATRLLESCSNAYDLYLVDPSTGTKTQLTSEHGRNDYGHLDARQLGSHLYVQVAGACGYTFVAKVTHGTTRAIKVPGAVGNIVMVNTLGSDLVLEHAASCDGQRPRSVLALFDPAQGKETPLVTLGRHEDFGGILVLGEVHATTY
jgi:WD40 repeat protein